MPIVNSTKTPKELVILKHPTAYSYDDGVAVYIRTLKTVTDKCPHCVQNWTHQVVDYRRTLGSGVNATDAWRNAAQRLGLM